MIGCDHLDDAALITAFSALAIESADFRHREHVRLGFAILVRERDLAAAVIAFRTCLQRFAATIGAAAKYHETLTWAYLIVIAERMHGHGYASSREFLAAHPDLLDHRAGAIAKYYDVAQITASPIARAIFVLPERR